MKVTINTKFDDIIEDEILESASITDISPIELLTIVNALSAYYKNGLIGDVSENVIDKMLSDIEQCKWVMTSENN